MALGPRTHKRTLVFRSVCKCYMSVSVRMCSHQLGKNNRALNVPTLLFFFARISIIGMRLGIHFI